MAFARLHDALGEAADWTVLPDIVAGGLGSLDLSMFWCSRIPGPQLLAVQDGMMPDDVRHLLGARRGIFVGGSTEWKLATARTWGQLAREVGCHLHIARVNTTRRIRLCQDAGADSFDGTSASRFAVTCAPLSAAVAQNHLFGGLNG